MRTTKPTRQRLSVVALASALSLALLAVPSAAEASQGGNGMASDPVVRGCVSDSYRVTYWNMINKKHHNQVQGRMDLMYSPSCGTNWVNIYGNVAGNTYSAAIKNQAGAYGNADLRGIGSEHSLQVAARGNACVTVGYFIIDANSGEVEGDNRYTIC